MAKKFHITLTYAFSFIFVFIPLMITYFHELEYRELHQLADLGWVDIDLDNSAMCLNA